MHTDFGTARRSRAQWQALLARATRSGLSVAEFCRREGVSTASFYTWRKRLGAAAGQEPAAAAPTCGPAFLDLGALGAGERPASRLASAPAGRSSWTWAPARCCA